MQHSFLERSCSYHRQSMALGKGPFSIHRSEKGLPRWSIMVDTELKVSFVVHVVVATYEKAGYLTRSGCTLGLRGGVYRHLDNDNDNDVLVHYLRQIILLNMQSTANLSLTVPHHRRGCPIGDTKQRFSLSSLRNHQGWQLAGTRGVQLRASLIWAVQGIRLDI